MRIKNTDRRTLIEAYNSMKECECQQQGAINQPSQANNERVDMIINNLVVLNNKTAELVKYIQTAIDSGEEIEEWVSEKIAVATNSISNINDYYIKYSNPQQQQVASLMGGAASTTTGLNLQPSTLAASFPLKTNMPPVTIAI